MEVLAIAAVALVGLWCLVVIPAMWLSGTMSQAEDDDAAGGTNPHPSPLPSGEGARGDDGEAVIDGR